MLDETIKDEQELPSIIWDELLLSLRQNKWLIMTITLLVVLGAYLALQFVSWKYEASARVLVKLGRENTELPAVVRNGGLLTTGVRKEEINSEIQLLTSESLITEVVDSIGYENFLFEPVRPDDLIGIIKYYLKLAYREVKATVEEVAVMLGLRKAYSEHDQVVMAMKRYLTVVREKDSDVISIHLQLPHPELAVRTVERMIEVYLDRHISVRRNGEVKTFFDRQAAEYHAQLLAIEEARDALRARLGVSDIGEQRRLILQRLDQLKAQRFKWLGDRQQLARSAEGQGDDVAAALSVPVITVETLPRVEHEVMQKRLALEKRLQSYGESSRPTRKLRSELVALEAFLRRGLDSLIVQNQNQIDQERLQLRLLDEAEDRLLRLERERMLAEKNYLAYAKRSEEANITEKMDLRRVSNIAVLAPPVLPVKPVAPKKMLIMGLSLPVGLLIAIGIVLLREYLNDRVRTARDLRSLAGLEYLGSFRVSS